ncbi:hypothetical protein JXL19_04475 [bacterium]|nr:hypothetical protein [bacterium]
MNHRFTKGTENTQKEIQVKTVKNDLSAINLQLYQKLSCAFCLITDVENYLKSVLKIINHEMSLTGSFAYYKQSNDSVYNIKSISNNNKNFSMKILSGLSDIIIQENLDKLTQKRHINIDKHFDAFIIPVYNKSTCIALFSFFYNEGSLSFDGCNADFIENYLVTALIGNYELNLRDNLMINILRNHYNFEISLKNLIKWRLEEIISNVLDIQMSGQNLHKEILHETEKMLIMATLEQTGNNKSLASKILGINRNTLMKKVKNLKMECNNSAFSQKE